MVKLSGEATIGLFFEVLVGILDHLHVREPFIIWGLFAVGLILIGDSIIRGEWAERIVDRKKRTARRIVYGVVAGLCFVLFGFWIFARLHTEGPREATITVPSSIQPQQPPPLPKAPEPDNAPTVKPIPRATLPKQPVEIAPKQAQQPPITQDCGGGNCAASVGQQGGITAGQINVGAVPKHISPQDASAVTDYLLKAKNNLPAQLKIVIAADQFSRPQPFVDEFYRIFKNAQWPMRDDGVNDVVTMSAPSTKKFQGAMIVVKGEPLKPGETQDVSAPNPLYYIGDVLRALNIERSLDRDPNAESDVIVIQFDGGFPN
jgi:hypothetical protein